MSRYPKVEHGRLRFERGKRGGQVGLGVVVRLILPRSGSYTAASVTDHPHPRARSWHYATRVVRLEIDTPRRWFRWTFRWIGDCRTVYDLRSPRQKQIDRYRRDRAAKGMAA